MQLVFNELSVAEKGIEINKGMGIFEQLIATYHEAVKGNNGFDRAILTSMDLNTLEVAENYSVSKWRNSKVDREIIRRFIGMCDRQKVDPLNSDESEMICAQKVGRGLLHAYENDKVCISFVYDIRWEEYDMPCTYYSLSDDQEYAVIVPNISKPVHLDENSKKIQELKERHLSGIKTAEQLLQRIDSLFPNLVFHEDSLRQLKNEVQVQHLDAICHKLMMLEKYFSSWDGTSFDETAFPNRSVSPQSKETLHRFKKAHTFVFPDGEILVSYHIRYTGNIPGRIYFHPVNEMKKAYICSLTKKLPSVSDPK